MPVAEMELTLSPEEAVAAWPRLQPMAVMWSGGAGWRARNPRCRWTILSRPVETRVVRAGPDARRELGSVLEEVGASGQGGEEAQLPFIGGYLGFVSYEAGAVIEPSASARGRHAGGAGQAGRSARAGMPAQIGTHATRSGSTWPLAVWHRCPGAYVHDRWTGQWWVVGDRESLPSLEARWGREPGAFILGSLRSDMGRRGYEERVARVVEYIRAGDVFQANLAHRLSGAFEGSARALFMELCRVAQPWHGAYIEMELPDQRAAVVSVSPELFLEAGPGARRVVTRPMKGTRPRRAGVQDLARSEKDAAELNMIVDLMRNDLGRVCRYGSVRVDEGRAIEAHAEGEDGGGAGVLQGVATVSGELREGVGLKELLFATFPPGSVTGAPKIRAMQIIDELEVSARGAYCGAIGYVSDHGHAALNVAIRTAIVQGKAGGVAADELADAELSYSVGAGIVADSKPDEEWRETLVKAGVITSLTSLREG